MRRRILMSVLAAIALVVSAAAAAAPAARPHAAGIGPAHLVRITVLSTRADLVTGGEALVQVVLPPGARPAQTRLDVNGRDVTREFSVRANGDFEGLVTGLTDGTNLLTARLPDGYGAHLTITNHPISGPIIAGPQLEPWKCEAGAVDAACDKPTTYSYVYKSTDPTKTGFQPYDPANPPTDVATTTTQTGATVPFIVRVETGYEDRDQYQIAALFQPHKPWTALAPQPQFNHKLLITHGVSCGVDYQTGTAPSVTSYNPSPVSSPVLPTADSGQYALGQGFAVMSTALDYSGHNCNLPLQAESLMIAKEHLIDSYGTLRYTIGTGCSGGSLAQQWIANAYPGIYQGILPTCSFPDAWGTATQFLDYHLMLAYFNDPSKWGTGVVWTPTQEAEAEGHVSIVNSEVSDNAQWHVAVPTDNCAGVTAAQRYNAQTNPGGVRCDIQDAAINVFGPDPAAYWSPAEKAAGHGFAVPPIDNVGVEYGLGALRQGQITPAQFIDLNAKIGGVDIDTNPSAARIATRGAALANAYRSGMINETNNLDQTAIIDCRGPDPGAFHDAYRAFAVRARLDREHGNHANQLIWEGPTLIIGDTQCNLNSLIAMDHWLGAVESDHSARTQAQKIAADKPAGLGDECYDGTGTKLSDGLCPPGVVPIYGTPRTVAGDAITTDANKCQLAPLSRAGDFGPIPFTDAQWTQLQSLFPGGVCDFSKPGVDQQPTIPWQTYQDAQGHVIYGGRPLGPAPVSIPFGPGAACARTPGVITGTSLGPVRLGMARHQIKRLFARFSTRGRRYMDFYCPTARGIRVGYPSPALLRTLPRHERNRVRGRAILVLTANHGYTLKGVHPGTRLAAVARRLRVGRPFRIGLNTWYLAPAGAGRGVLKVRRGRIEEIGIADKRLTTGRAASRRFLARFS
ncbi:MAG TPA: DUF6351 family protein [Solirubrobacteraceae bacterium]|nr:DUF6351 family protein [Solirubrobacteraceae bacterium]